MKRFLIICLLFFALPLSAQEPEQDPIRVQTYLAEYRDMNPWGSISFVERYFYFGDLTFWICDGANRADLELRVIAYRFCEETFWGSPFPNTCYFSHPRRRNFAPLFLTWDEEFQAYTLRYTWEGIGTSLTILTVEKDAYILEMGLVTNGVWNPLYTYSKYVIQPKTAKKGMPSRDSGKRMQ